MADPGKVSASKISTYMGCSAAYYFQYEAHEKVPTPVNLLFGKTVHYLTDHFYDVNFKSVESFVKFWRHYWSEHVSGVFKWQGKKRA